MNSNIQQISFSNIQHYSDRIKEVLDVIEKKNNIDSNNNAVDYTRKRVREIYGNIKRKFGGGLYYDEHLEGVRGIVGSAIKDNNDLRVFTEIIALLHDVVEDNLMTYEEVENDFSQEVRHIIWTLSESKESRRFKEAHIGKFLTFVDNGKTIKREYTKKDMKVDMLRESLLKIKLLKNLPNKLYYQASAMVRVADMIHNLSDFRIQNKNLLERNIYKSEIILKELNDTVLTQSLKDIVDELKWLFDKEKN